MRRSNVCASSPSDGLGFGDPKTLIMASREEGSMFIELCASVAAITDMIKPLWQRCQSAISLWVICETSLEPPRLFRTIIVNIRADWHLRFIAYRATRRNARTRESQRVNPHWMQLFLRAIYP